MATDDVTPIATRVASTSKETTGISIDAFASAICGINLNEHTMEIVAALGGIDQILNDHIRIAQRYPEEGMLNTAQIQNITNIINPDCSVINALETACETPLAETFWDKLYGRAKLMDNTFNLDRSDTLLHSIFKTEEFADRLIDLLISKIAILVFSSLLLSYIIIFEFLNPMMDEETWFFILDCIILIAIILYFFLVILSCNIPIMLLIMTGFDFWVKCGYAVCAGVVNALYNRRTAAAEDWDIKVVIAWDMQSFMFVLVIIAVSFVEGYHVSWKTAFAFGLALSLITSYYAVLYTLMWDLPEQELQAWEGGSFGMIEFIGSSYRVMSLFLWKQTLMTAYTKGEWCICVYTSPYIKWQENVAK